MKTPNYEEVCALLGRLQPRPIQIAPILPKKDKVHHIGVHLSSEEHEAVRRGVSALIKSGVPMNKSAFVRLAVRLAADAYAESGAGVEIRSPTE